jgi:tricorn protease
MMNKKNMILFGLVLILFISYTTLYSQVNARMLRYPDVSETHICFVYAGDIWVVAKQGGLAHRLSSPKGEESFPRFSPDGQRIAFTGNYDGNEDIYVLPFMGGEPQRVTFHGLSDRMLDWFSDGQKILYASSRESGRMRYNQFYSVSPKGGFSEKLPVPYGEFGMLAEDNKTLAYTPITRDFRTWKRYRGGMAPDIWLFDLETLESKNITQSDANETQPMWHGNKLYFLSDRGDNKRYNIWVYDRVSEESKQITHFKEYDIHFPAIGPQDIVFEAGGKLYLLDLNTEQHKEINIEIVTDSSTKKARIENASSRISNAFISPDGQRVLIEARGEIFSVPKENGVIKNLTQSSGSAQRYPAWSPDGKKLAFWSDQTGEYQLIIKDLTTENKEEVMTSYDKGFYYHLFWSPDSKKLAFVTCHQEIKIFDLEQKKTLDVDKGLWMTHGVLENFKVDWSSDSQWMTYSRGLKNRHDAVFIYNIETNQRYQLTTDYYNNSNPVFDPEGKYLYLFSNRTFSPVYSDLDNSFVYPNTTNVAAVALTEDIEIPLPPQNDEVEIKEEKEEGEDKKEEENKEEKKVEITVKDFEQRMIKLPMQAGNYSNLSAVPGKIIYLQRPRSGSGERTNELKYFDLKEREEKTITQGINDYMLSSDGKNLLVYAKGKFSVISVSPNQKMEKFVPTETLEMTVDPPKEWTQIFTDAWRIVRDYFYDPNMHGVDWAQVKEQYGKLLENVVTRRDLNFLIGEMIAELNASHTYRGGGDVETAPSKAIGYLGVNWEVSGGFYRIKSIMKGAEWDFAEVCSPLLRTKNNVKIEPGYYVLEINGVKLTTDKSPWYALQGLAGKTVELTVNDKPGYEGAKKAVVNTLNQGEVIRLRHLGWIESNRKYVEEMSDGQVGYIYVRSTGVDAQNELVRQFNAQFHKKGLIIDERFNSGGQIPDRFIELLNRKPLAYWATRDGKDWQWPPVAHFGPKAMLINGWSGSGGDCFPDYFKKAGLGPLIGMRTWGGLIGVSGTPPLIDGGMVTAPTFRMYNPDGTWFREGYGVPPDIQVVDDPTLLAKGTDPQLKRAAEEVIKIIQKAEPIHPKRPDYEDRSK